MKTDWNNFKLGRIKQGKLVGFDGEMLWNFDVTLAIFIRDGLTAYKESSHGIPGLIYDKYDADKTLSQKEKDSKSIAEWHTILNDIIAGFNAYINIGDSEGLGEELGAKNKAFEKGLKLLSEWWGSLWD